jgi:4-hydroxy-4-methyl-2-oxoglutarate aldolase
MATEISHELVELYARLRTTDVSDALDSLGIMDRQTMNADMRPLWEGCKFAGLARTVQLYPSTRVLHPVSYEEYDASFGQWTDGSYNWSSKVGKTPDQVWVIDEGGISAGLLGSMNTLDGMTKGVRGYVIDGVCRDSDEVIMQRGSVCCTLRRPSHVYGRTCNAQVDVPIVCAGVCVQPGDVILVDGDGVVVVPQGIAEEVARRAKLILDKDKVARGRLYEKLGWAPDASVTI